VYVVAQRFSMGRSGVSNHVIYGVAMTFVVMIAWTYPLVSPTWHDKQWFVGPAGIGAIITMEIGLTSYKLTACCECPNIAAQVKLMCDAKKEGSPGNLGTHDLAELMDLSCNAEETSFGVIRGCDTVKLLYYVSLATCAMICISLLPLVAGCFGMLYFELGYNDTYETKSFVMAMYYGAPCVQLLAVGMYGLCTMQLDEMFNPGMLGAFFPVNLVINSPKVVTLAHGYVIAIALMSICFILPCFTAHYLTVSDQEYLYDECGNPIQPDGYAAAYTPSSEAVSDPIVAKPSVTALMNDSMVGWSVTIATAP